MHSRTLTLEASLEQVYVQIAQSVNLHKGHIVQQQAPHHLCFSLEHSSLWSGFAQVELRGQVELEADQARTIARIELDCDAEVQLEPVFTAVFGQVFLGPLALWIKPNPAQPV